MIIRRTIEDDIPELCSIVSKNYNRETAEHFFDEVSLSFSSHLGRPWFYTALTDANMVVGCAGYGPSWTDYGAYSLFWVNVGPADQDCGFGKALVDRCLLDLVSRANVVILATTVPEFYSKVWGFKTVFVGQMAMCNTIMALELRKGQTNETSPGVVCGGYVRLSGVVPRSTPD